MNPARLLPPSFSSEDSSSWMPVDEVVVGSEDGDGFEEVRECEGVEEFGDEEEVGRGDERGGGWVDRGGSGEREIRVEVER